MGLTHSKPQPERQFTCFGRLPTELRLMIWKYSLPIRNEMIYPYPRIRYFLRVLRIKSEDWHDCRPAHLSTCWEAREVALKYRTWEYTNINMVYLAGDLEAWAGDWTGSQAGLGFWRVYMGRVRTLAVDGMGPYYTGTEGRKLFQHRKSSPDMALSVVMLSRIFGPGGFMGAREAGLEKILLVIGTLKCKGLEWLFAESDLVVLRLLDPRVKRALDQLQEREDANKISAFTQTVKQKMRRPPAVSANE
ncbi:hypothetical protein GGR58DRAFT_507426 [Xylaria digitata]|nr:hypothetical protein GGR58DRAFT_507426 [Xylaria digitata]